MTRRILGIFVLLLLPLAALADLTLVEQGQPRAVIVVAKEALTANPDPTTIWTIQPGASKTAAAARDLQVYIEKMSGAKLPLVGDDAPLPAGVKILVGLSALTGPYAAKIPHGETNTRDEEGFAILTDGNTLVLAGNEAPPYHGTEYAVSALLHRLGVRWYMPGEYGEVVPTQKTITVPALNVVSKPDFKMRNWWVSYMAADLGPIEYRWKIRNGMNPLLHFITLPADSSVRSVLPPEAEKDNPLYADVFARDLAGKVYPHMPNLSSDKSVAYAANYIKDYFRKHPEAKSYGIGADDGLPRDFSAGTGPLHMDFPSLIGRFNDANGGSTTEEWMQWVERVAADVYKEFPDHIITTNGYANRDTPPITNGSDRKIWIMFAAIWSDTYHAYNNPKSWMTQRQYNMLKEWTSRYDNVYMYNYLYHNLVGCGAPPIPLARRHMYDMPMLKRIGVVGFSDEGRTVRGESGIFPTYLRARMMWDAGLDANALMNEYFTNWYGPAAKPAKAYWDAMEAAIEQSNIGGTEDHMLSLIYTPELIKQLEVYLKQAEALAKGTPVVEQHVLADRVVYDHLIAYKAMERAEAEANFAEAARQAQRMVDIRKPATGLSRFYFDPNPSGDAHGFYYWGAVQRRNYYQKMAELTNGTAGEMVAVLPESVKFAVDPRDDGRFDGWFHADYQDQSWTKLLTTKPFFAQGPWLDKQGFPYEGVLWYRAEVDVPATAQGKTVKLYAQNAETEAWVWVNGQFVGHRPYIEAYIRPNPIDLDVTSALVPGKRNVVAIRLHTNYQPAQMAAGLVSRLFLYAPKGK